MKIWGLVLSILGLVSCSEKGLQAPFQTSQIDQGVIYVRDSRLESSEVKSKIYQEEKQASLAMIFQRKLHLVAEDTYQVRARTLVDQYNFCPDQKYADQKAAAACSSTLIAEDLVLTAGHCLPAEGTCSEMAFVVGYDETKARSGQQFLKVDQVYSCQKVEYLSIGDQIDQPDMAIVRLDRKVVGINPVDLSTSREVLPDEGLFSFSYPSGLPQKFLQGKVRTHAPENQIFRAAIDVFHGSSGALVYSQADHAPLGIVLGGEEDYSLDPKKLCYKPKICAKGGCAGEKILKTTAILKEIARIQEIHQVSLDIVRLDVKSKE